MRELRWLKPAFNRMPKGRYIFKAAREDWKQRLPCETMALGRPQAMTSDHDTGAREAKIQKIEEFLETLIASSGLDLRFKILASDGHAQAPAQVSSPASEASSRPDSGASAPGGDVSAEISVEFTGRDAALLTARNAELLHAIEHLAAKALRLEPERHHLISFDAENFKLLRSAELQMIAAAAVERVRSSGRPHAFPPMNSRERRLLHLALSASGLPTASTGDGPRRFVVLYPEGQQPTAQPSTEDRSHAIRKTFRRR
jgi:spoIIIJ-associated protein